MRINKKTLIKIQIFIVTALAFTAVTIVPAFATGSTRG